MRWGRVNARGQRCAYGCEISPGAWAWLGKWRRGYRFVVCVSCGRDRYEMSPPADKGERDGKVEALGASER